MTGADLDLGDYEDDIAPPAGDPAATSGDAADVVAADPLAELFAKAQAAAMAPKPTIKEMINVVSIVASEIEDAQLRLMITRASDKPHPPYMRRAATLIAARNFLLLIEANRAAVKKVLRGNS
jgi:hypothetical protein